jgi:hypothetical protein
MRAILSYFTQFFSSAFIITFSQYLYTLFNHYFLHAAFKIAITLAFIAVVVAAVYAYVDSATAIVHSLSASVPTIVSGVWGWVMPGNVFACFLALSSAVLLRFFTNLYRKLLDYKFKATLSN